MNSWLNKTRTHFKDKSFLISLFAAVILLLISFVINFYAGIYATLSASNSVTDIILSNINVYNVDNLFIYGPIYFWIFVTIILLAEPRHIPFTLKTIALFIIVRALFISMTHIGPFPTQLVLEPNSVLEKFAFGGDLFFSGHTGLPFLMALIFWKHKYLRFIFFTLSLMFGVIVLLGHLHYSIDVFSAFFITYTIFHIALYLFKKDRKLFSY